MIIKTRAHGDIDESLTHVETTLREVGELGHGFEFEIKWSLRATGEVVRHERHFSRGEGVGDYVGTIRGLMHRSQLARTVLVFNNPGDFAVAMEWRASDGELVRRDAHVIVKEIAAEAAAVAASIG